MSILQITSLVILTATLAVAIWQLRLLRIEIRDDHDWRRRDKAVGFSQIYSPHLREVKHRINDTFGYIQARTDPLSSDEIDAACKQDGRLREDINYLLSYLENVGMCCKYHVADFAVVYDLMANTYLKYYYLFQPLIIQSQRRNPRLWSNIEWMKRAIENEHERRKEPEPVLPRTGHV
jgi:hypothetical protein